MADEMDDISLDGDSTNGDFTQDNSAAEEDALDETVTKEGKAKKQGFAYIVPLMVDNYVLPILKEVQQSKEDTDISGENDTAFDTDGEANARGCEGQSGGTDYSKIADGVVSFFKFFRDTKAKEDDPRQSRRPFF